MTESLTLPGMEPTDGSPVGRSPVGRRGWNEHLPPQCVYNRDWLDHVVREEVTRRCRDLEPSRARVRMYGRSVLRPRATAWFAANGCDYVYSGTRECCRGWPQWIADLAARIACSPAWDGALPANGVLLNVYESGKDHVAWHADDEPEVSQDAPIASLSLGAARRFQVRRTVDHAERFRQELEPGSLLIMPKGFQMEFEHAVPAVKSVVGPRWNLTFRVYARIRR